MKKAVLLSLCLFGTLALPLGFAWATPMSLDISSGYNYDSVGTSTEITNANTKTGNHRLTDVLGGHNLANNGRAFTNTDSLASGTALARYGVVGNFVNSFTYDNGTGTAAVSNTIRTFSSATSGTTVTSTLTVTVNSVEQLNYSDLNLLFVQNRSAGAGTYQTTITATYTDGTTTVSDTGAVAVAANVAGGTLGSAGVNNQGGLSNSTDTNTAVTNEFSSSYGVITTGTSGSFASAISSAAGSGTNLWQLTTPIALTSTKVLKAITFTVSAAGAGNWNELVVFGADATLPENTPPPASDPTVALNVTFNPTQLSQHPRLMITPQTLPAIKAFYTSSAGAIWKSEFDAYVGSSVIPVNTQFLTDGTEAQRQSFWRLPTAALDYLLNGNQTSFNHALGFLQLYVSLPDWETSVERNSGLSAANNLVGVALAYDWLYNSLDPTFREQVRQKLFQQARAMYYDGYQLGNSSVSAIYWQNDPLNNHRWARVDGLALAVMASYTGDPSQNYMMNQTAAELAFINTWLSPSGTSHESVSYQVFGGNHLTMAMQSSDDCLGTTLLNGPFWQNVGRYRMQMLISSFNNGCDFGDYTSPAFGGYNNFLLKVAAHNNDLDLRNGLVTFYNQSPSAFDFGWFSILWDNSGLTGGNYKNIPLTGYYSDLGIGVFKDSWTPGGVAAMFKCAPLGGVSMNKYRDANGETYVNVAHDDPDANSFIIFDGDDNVAGSDQYSQHKSSLQQNTVLVNGTGQNPVGRTDGQFYEQPATSGSMAGMATSFPSTNVNGATLEEGEASGSYPVITSGTTRPQISRYRRLFLWSANKYILLLDDLRSPSAVAFNWLVQGPSVTTVNSGQGLFNLAAGTHTCGFQVIGTQALTYATIASPADNRGISLGYQQLQATASATTNVQLASIFNPWSVTNLRVALQNVTATGAVVAVTGNGIADNFQWTFATSSSTPSSFIQLIPPGITSAAPTSPATLNTAYNYTMTATGSPAPTFGVTAGGLPNGLTLSTSGLISGTPTQTGLFTGTITASNGVNPVATQNFSINVTAGGYSAWVAQEGLSGNNALKTAINAPDHLMNLVKYALGLHAFTTYNPGAASLPYVQIKNVAGVNYLTLTFTGTATDVTYNVQATSNILSSWSTVKSYPSGGSAPGTVTVQDSQSIPAANPTQRQMRLNVTSP